LAHPHTLLIRKVDFQKGRELYERYFEGNQPEQGLKQDTDDQNDP